MFAFGDTWLAFGREPCHVSLMTKPAEIKKRLKAATLLLDIAERELDAAMKDLRVVERSHKQMISRELQAAFEKVSGAKRKLELAARNVKR